jgi:hypothetical protein
MQTMVQVITMTSVLSELLKFLLRVQEESRNIPKQQ